MQVHTDRRDHRREPLYLSRRRYARVRLDVDWFIESAGCSTLGRGLDLSPRGALLPIARTGAFGADVTLFVCLPGRPRMFRAVGVAHPARGPRGWLIKFHRVASEDLALLGEALIEQAGLAALPALDRKYGKYTALPRRYLARAAMR